MSLTKLNLFFAMMTSGGSVIMDQTYNQYTLPYFLIMCAVWLISVIVVTTMNHETKPKRTYSYGTSKYDSSSDSFWAIDCGGFDSGSCGGDSGGGCD